MGHFTHFYKMLLPAREDVWIETGTYRGDSIDIALECGFRELHSIEVCPRLYEAAAPRFAGNQRVHLHLGSSPDVLDRLLTPAITSRSTVIWLDAHFQGYARDEMDEVRGECPLLEELDVIVSRTWSAPVLVAIDDVRLFQGEFPEDVALRAEAWPTIEDVRTRLEGWRLVETRQCLFADDPRLRSFLPKNR